LSNDEQKFFYANAYEKKAWVYRADSVERFQFLLQSLMDGEQLKIDRLHKPRVIAKIDAPGVIVCAAPLDDAVDADGALRRRTIEFDLRADNLGKMHQDDFGIFRVEMAQIVLPAAVTAYMQSCTDAHATPQNA
jgi:hypothetical protein